MHRQSIMLGRRHLDHIRGHFLAEHTEYRCDQLSLAVRRKYLLAVADQRERNLRMGERRVLYHTQNIACLGEVLFEELHACRCVVEQVAYHNGRALRTAGLLLCLNIPCFKVQVQTCDRICLTGKQVDTGDRRNRCQRLAAKAQRTDGIQILLGAQLACRMAAERHRRILCRHTAAVIRNTQIGDAAVFDLYRDTGRARIYCIFYELLCHGGWPFNNLARSDQVRKMRR